MNKKLVQALYAELPQLVAQGVLTPEAANQLHAHYGAVDTPRTSGLAILIFGVLGALLIGAGIILVLAHNWDGLPRSARAALSFLPLLLAQSLAAWALLRRPQSLAWREGSSALLFLMIGASISLVAQTYNISGDLPRFLLTWALLGLPLVYLFDTLVPAILTLWGFTEWACHLRCEDSFNAGYWLLAALLLPQLLRWLRVNRYQVRPTILLWALCVSVTIAAGVTIERVLPGLWIILYSGLFALMFLAGEFWFNETEGFWSRPLRHFGSGGLLVMAFLLTFEWPWHEIGWDYWRWNEHMRGAAWRAIPDAVLGSVIPIAAITLLAMTRRRKKPLAIVLGIAPILAALSYGLTNVSETYAPAAGIYDLYLLAVGLWLMITGIRIGQQGQMNVGLLAVTALILARFFDSDLSFLLRGLLFIALGIAFLVANITMLRRKGTNHEQA